MESLRELYKIGVGPSSSHTMGPERAAKIISLKYPDADKYVVTLYGSLAKTGIGHRTDYIIKKTLSEEKTEIIFDENKTDIPHPNTMQFKVFKEGSIFNEFTVLSIGGGDIRFMGDDIKPPKRPYELSTFSEISEYCKAHDMRLWQYVEMVEGFEIWDFLQTIWDCMKNSIKEGVTAEGEIFGGLHVLRKAKQLYNYRHMDELSETKENRLVCSYAFAVSEQNASCNGKIVTAPTCGASGVLPAVLKYTQDKRKLSDSDILRALATGGLIGNIIKTNASISGAEAGCQAEIGSACSMAAAALGELYEMDIDQIEYAAEVAMEHHLGLTCDPVKGLVQIPCIERNAVAAMRAINAVNLANFLAGSRKISFDLVVKTMYETGKDLHNRYRETSEGGLAKLYN
ncbi:MAG: L-serine ammonia-lyase, iron-sulfur-dependent, subunit alpha [Clostridia bacterium]|nr:L-serine ammonia-lyase, iron-sulfur-dependent, subunit alpha [Clostridia bacterium]